jgi:nucleoid associated protein NdpA
MQATSDILLKQLIIHKIGNPTRGEELKMSAGEMDIQEETLNAVLKKYFLSSFNENEMYHFSHLTDVKLNEVYTYVSAIFENHDSFVEQSRHIAQFLYTKSTHIKVKEGELYVAFFENLPFGDKDVSGIGLFKSENRDTFLTVFPKDDDLALSAEAGININKLDKGCLVFRQEGEDGYRLCLVDNTNKQQEAQYWVNDFLQVSPLADSYHQTDKYLNMCKLFITNEYADKFEVTKSDQVEMLGRSMDYFKTNEQFSLDEFADQVIHHEEVKDSFMKYKKNFEASKNFGMDDEFDIHLSAVKKQASAFKTVVKLDKNFHIYIHGRRDLIERGIDEMNGKKYYKIYYEEEH